MSLKKKGVEGIKWTFFENVLVQGFAFVTTILLTRVLLPQDFGLIGIIMVFLAVSKAIIESGLGTSLIRDNEANDRDFSTVFLANLGISLILYLILFFLAPSIARFFEDARLTEILRVLSLSLILSAASSIQNKILIKTLAFKKLALLRMPGIVLGSCVGVYCAYSGMSYWSLVVRELVIKTVDAIMLWTRANWTPKLIFDIKKFRYHFDFGYKLMLTGILNTVFTEIYALVIGRFFSLDILGFFNRANKFIKLPRKLMVNVVTKPTFPLISKIKDDKVKVTHIYRQIIRGLFFIVAPVFVMLAATAEPLFTVLLTDKWRSSAEYFQILCLGSMLYPILNLNLNIFKVYGRTDLTLRLAIIRKLLVIIVVILGITFGMEVLLWGMVVSTYFAFFINSWYSEKMINYGPLDQIKDLIPTLLISLTTGALGYLMVEKMTMMSELLKVVLAVVAMTISYVTMSFVSRNQAMKDFTALAAPFVQKGLKKFKKS